MLRLLMVLIFVSGFGILACGGPNEAVCKNKDTTSYLDDGVDTVVVKYTDKEEKVPFVKRIESTVLERDCQRALNVFGHCPLSEDMSPASAIAGIHGVFTGFIDHYLVKN